MAASRMIPSLMATMPTWRREAVGEAGCQRGRAGLVGASAMKGRRGRMSRPHMRAEGAQPAWPPGRTRAPHAARRRTLGCRYQQGWPRRVMDPSMMSSATRKKAWVGRGGTEQEAWHQGLRRNEHGMGARAGAPAAQARGQQLPRQPPSRAPSGTPAGTQCTSPARWHGTPPPRSGWCRGWRPARPPHPAPPCRGSACPAARCSPASALRSADVVGARWLRGRWLWDREQVENSRPAAAFAAAAGPGRRTSRTQAFEASGCAPSSSSFTILSRRVSNTLRNSCVLGWGGGAAGACRLAWWRQRACGGWRQRRAAHARRSVPMPQSRTRPGLTAPQPAHHH